jgi:hypothetical protein
MSVTGAHAHGAGFTPAEETNYQYSPTTYAIPSTSAGNEIIGSTTPFINTSPPSLGTQHQVKITGEWDGMFGGWDRDIHGMGWDIHGIL